MKVPESNFWLKSGELAEIRSPLESEAAPLLTLQKQMSTETEFLLRVPEEWEDRTNYSQLDHISKVNNSADQAMLCCYVQGQPVAICKLWFETLKRERHRATVSIAVSKAYWRRGIGLALLNHATFIASQRQGVKQLELMVIDSNKPAIKLYRKARFKRVARLPKQVMLGDGKYHARYLMLRIL